MNNFDEINLSNIDMETQNNGGSENNESNERKEIPTSNKIAIVVIILLLIGFLYLLFFVINPFQMILFAFVGLCLFNIFVGFFK